MRLKRGLRLLSKEISLSETGEPSWVRTFAEAKGSGMRRRCRVFLKLHGVGKGLLKPFPDEKFPPMRAGGTVVKVHYASLSQKWILSRWGW